ncbi:hypothetical protein [Photobacterium iliopiscarium]|uniref:hypothetical protein n=1 Tax=Photobacterium iliopiscarium TaxID=56192 RepID=UPI001E3C3743|nr:hypothetical protein [Photobacterium iliopiscarium]
MVDKLPLTDIHKLTLLIDTTSPVAGFEQQAKVFIEKMAILGISIANTTDIMAG